MTLTLTLTQTQTLTMTGAENCETYSGTPGMIIPGIRVPSPGHKPGTQVRVLLLTQFSIKYCKQLL